MKTTKVKELMTEHPVLISPDTNLKEAAMKMRDIDCGVLPVGTQDKLSGIITDRDIVVRAVCNGKDPNKEHVKDYMSDQIYACSEEDTLEQAADQMRMHKVSRLVVQDSAGKVCGILTFGAILRNHDDQEEITNVVQHATRARAA